MRKQHRLAVQPTTVTDEAAIRAEMPHRNPHHSKTNSLGSYANLSILEFVMRAASSCRWLTMMFLSSASGMDTMTDGTRRNHAETPSNQASSTDRVRRSIHDLSPVH